MTSRSHESQQKVTRIQLEYLGIRRTQKKKNFNGYKGKISVNNFVVPLNLKNYIRSCSFNENCNSDGDIENISLMC
jgi:hypothetical protein